MGHHHDRARGDSHATVVAGKLRPPEHVRLLAARLYWGARPPSYPSLREMHTDLRRTATYYAHVSRGRQQVHVELSRWVHVRASADTMCNTQIGSARAATTALRHAGYHPGRFDRLMLFTEQCHAASSAAQLPGRLSWIRYPSPGMATLVHELGHNLGLGHAYGVVCRQDGRRVALGGTCQPVEYGDSWDAMGHSKGFFSAPELVRLGWAGKIRDVRGSGTFRLADVQRSRSADQALRIRAGRTTYWVEYQPQHSPVIGRTIPGVMIRRQVDGGPVELVDASPGNPTGHLLSRRRPDQLRTPGREQPDHAGAHPDHHGRDGRHATVRVAFDRTTAVPDAPVVRSAAQVGGGGYQRPLDAPTDNGQIVLGYRVTSWPSGRSTFVRSPAGYHTSVHVPLDKSAIGRTTFTVRALNQDGWSARSDPLRGTVYGPNVSVTSPSSGAKLARGFTP